MRKTILIVDDELSFRRLLKKILEGRFDIIEGSNGYQAVELARKCQPDLIILDIDMPESDGIEACHELKSDILTRKIPVILFTDRSEKEDMVRGLKVGADDYFTRPVYAPELLARIDAHLRTSDLYSDLEDGDLRFLLEISEEISALRNPMAILRMIVDRMAEVINVARCSMITINDAEEVIVKASSDLAMNEELKIDIRKYPEIQESMRSRQAVIVNDIANDPLMESVRSETKGLCYDSIVVIPVVKKQSVIGTFFLRTASPIKGGITDRVYSLCQRIANISANALENAILFESVQAAQEYFQDMAIRDGLTGLFNHRHFYDRLEEEFSRAMRYNAPLSLVFFDLDDFKRINDVYGHARGDAVLKKIGQVLKSIARESDIPARYGGEEFVIVLPNTDREGAFDVANRIRIMIREHQFDHLGHERVAISGGTATYLDKNLKSFNDLITIADERLYKGKSCGKDQIYQE